MKEIYSKYMPVLTSAGLFDGLTEEDIESVLNCLSAELPDFPKNSFIMRRGERSERIGLVLSGSVLVMQEDFWGNRSIMAKLTPGDTFAEAFACSENALMNADVLAAEDCTVLLLHIKKLPDSCGAHGIIIKNLLRETAEKNIRITERMTVTSRRTTREKLLAYLSAESARQGKTAFTIPFDRQQLADYLCVDRSAMSAELCRLRDSGVLRFERSHFELFSEEASPEFRL